MARCEGSTLSGQRCRHVLQQGRFCAKHRMQEHGNDLPLVALGMFISQLVAPGIGPALFGALGGKALALANRPARRQPRVFVSFDFDNDQSLKHLFVGQTRNSRTPFELADYSLKEAAPERGWKDKARAKIRRSDLVVVLVGTKTYAARGVLAEVNMAREEGKPVVQMIRSKGGPYRRVPGAGRVISWNWPSLGSVLAKTA